MSSKARKQKRKAWGGARKKLKKERKKVKKIGEGEVDTLDLMINPARERRK